VLLVFFETIQMVISWHIAAAVTAIIDLRASPRPSDPSFFT